MKIVIPHYVCGTYDEFRKFAGTTPLGRDVRLWDQYSQNVKSSEGLYGCRYF